MNNSGLRFYILFSALLISCSPAEKRVASWLSAGEDRFEFTSSSIESSRESGMILSVCSIENNKILLGNNHSINVKEAFIEQRHSIGSLTGELRLLDSANIIPKLVIVAQSRSEIEGLLVGTAHIQARGVPYEYVYGVGGSVLVLQLAKRHLWKNFALLAGSENQNGRYEEHSVIVKPQTLIARLNKDSGADSLDAQKGMSLAESDSSLDSLNSIGIDENAAIFNSTAADSRRVGMLLSTCNVFPKLIEGDNNFRLDIDQAFIELDATITTMSRQITPVSARGIRMIMSCKPGSYLGEIGVDWDIQLNDNTNRCVHFVPGEKNLLLLYIPEHYKNDKFYLTVKFRDKLGRGRKEMIEINPLKD